MSADQRVDAMRRDYVDEFSRLQDMRRNKKVVTDVSIDPMTGKEVETKRYATRSEIDDQRYRAMLIKKDIEEFQQRYGQIGTEGKPAGQPSPVAPQQSPSQPVQQPAPAPAQSDPLGLF